MQIGQMKYPIYLQSKVSTTSASGQQLEVWTNATDPVFSAIDWQSAGEKTEGSQPVGRITGKFTIHNIGTITSENTRISYNNEVYEVTSVLPIKNDVFLELMATVTDNENVS